MSIAKRAVRWIENLAPIAVFFSFFIGGVLLLLLAIGAHLDAFTVSGSVRVFGYVREINWGLNYILFIPIALFFAAATINSIPSAIDGLSRSRMVISKVVVPEDRDTLLASWHTYGSQAMIITVCLSSMGILVSAFQWFSVCLLPALSQSAGKLAPGWNIAWHATDPTATRWGCALFGILAYIMQAGVAVGFLTFATFVVVFAVWIFDHTKDSTETELYPDPRSDDRRRGFQNFESFIENLLLASIAFFFVFFMTRLDGLYVYSSSNSISSFIVQNVFLEGFSQALKQKGIGWLFDMGNTADGSTTLVSAGFCLSAVLSFLVPIAIVRQTARRSQQRFLNRLQDSADNIAV